MYVIVLTDRSNVNS